MPTLGVDATITLATDKTRQTLDNFYRGIKVAAVQVLPYSYISDSGDAVFTFTDASFVLFVGDVYDGSDPFDLIIVTNDDTEVTFTQTNFLMLNASNLKGLRVKSSVEDKIGYKVYYG